jgi:hypothetical protein
MIDLQGWEGCNDEMAAASSQEDRGREVRANGKGNGTSGGLGCEERRDGVVASVLSVDEDEEDGGCVRLNQRAGSGITSARAQERIRFVESFVCFGAD